MDSSISAFLGILMTTSGSPPVNPYQRPSNWEV